MTTARTRFTLAALLTAALLVSCSGSNEPIAGNAPSGDLVIFHAGSLSVPFKEIAAAFNQEYPQLRIIREAAGSRACARKIIDLHKPCDVIATADYMVIEELLTPDYAKWCIKFASNEMVIAYHDRSRRADEISAQNWHEILADDAVAFGRSDPNSDPCGYRTVLTLKLAERHYGIDGLAQRLLAKDTRRIRPKETDLLTLLEVNEIDYLFIYRSVAEQHALRHLKLPDAINLKSPEFASLYRTASVEISGHRSGEVITRHGEPMVYGVGIPENTPNREAALAFVAFLLQRDQGGAIMAKNGQGSVVPAPTISFDAVPNALKQFARRPE